MQQEATAALTDHAALLLHNRAQIAEDLVELMDAALDLADLGLALGDERLLELHLGLRWPDLRDRLRLSLLLLLNCLFL
jgi:hypothetical protein